MAVKGGDKLVVVSASSLRQRVGNISILTLASVLRALTPGFVLLLSETDAYLKAFWILFVGVYVSLYTASVSCFS